MLKRSHKRGFCTDTVTLNELLIKSGSSLQTAQDSITSTLPQLTASTQKDY